MGSSPDFASNSLILSEFKACVRYFLSNFYFFTKWQPFKNHENVFYFIDEALFLLEIFNFLWFLSFPHIPDSKGQVEVE